MTSDGAKLFRALVRSEMAEHPHGALLPHGCTVTISRMHGCGADEIATGLAAALGVRRLNRELLDAIVEEARVDRAAIARLDDHVTPIVSDWLYSLVSRDSTDRDFYRRHLVTVLLKISQTGGVIVGRGAFAVLSHLKAFNVRLVGSPDACAQRVARCENLTRERALQKCRMINAEREAFVRTNFDRDPADPANWHLILNTDRLSAQTAVDTILTAMHGCGFDLPPKALERLHLREAVKQA